jgi:hypothetical protein
MAAEKGEKAAPVQQGVSFSSFLMALLIDQRSFIPLLKAYICC